MYRFDTERHIHLYENQPLFGTSTLIGEVMPPRLAKWGAQCAVDFIEKNWGEYYDEKNNIRKTNILADAVNAWTKVRKDAATKGTDMHKDLKDYVQLCIEMFEGTPQVGETFTGKVGDFAEWANNNVKQFIFSEKNTYSRALWVGGVVDCLAQLRNGKLAVIDFKSSKEAYFNSFAQVAGYAAQLEESGWSNADGEGQQTLPEAIGALIVIPFGAKVFKPVMVENVEGFKSTFVHIVEVYKLLQAFKNR